MAVARYKEGIALALAMTLCALGPAGADPTSDVKAKAEEAIGNAMSLERPRQIGLAAIFDGNKYVQCRRVPSRDVRCEAGGALMQISLSRVLTPARIERLATMGWRPDPSFGNYVRVFPATETPSAIAEAVLLALKDGYDADLALLEFRTDWVADSPCPTRNGPTQNLAGSISDAESMKYNLVHGCSFVPPVENAPRAITGSVSELIQIYGSRMASEIRRLRINSDRRVYVIFDPGIGYFQCSPQPTREVYCEAQSADSWAALSAVLTPERIEQLHTAGFADPGHAPNYSKTYPATVSESDIAREGLTLLHDIYGYNGKSKLEVETEKGKSD